MGRARLDPIRNRCGDLVVLVGLLLLALGLGDQRPFLGICEVALEIKDEVCSMYVWMFYLWWVYAISGIPILLVLSEEFDDSPWPRVIYPIFFPAIYCFWCIGQWLNRRWEGEDPPWTFMMVPHGWALTWISPLSFPEIAEAVEKIRWDESSGWELVLEGIIWLIWWGYVVIFLFGTIPVFFTLALR